jgi:hypothetical protein
MMISSVISMRIDLLIELILTVYVINHWISLII